MRRIGLPLFLCLFLLAGALASDSQPESHYLASKRSQVFHKPACTHAQKIDPANVEKYETRQAAEAAGKRPCKTCKP